MPRVEVLDTTIITYAHEIVANWWRNPTRGPFTHALRDAERKLVDSILVSDAHRKAAFRQVATAIRVAQGHIATNPKPLVDLLRMTLDRVPATRR